MKPTTHATITNLAMLHCRRKLSNNLRLHTHEIIQGTVDEDEASLGIFKRATNWHFYREKNSPIPKKVYKIFKTTSEDILKERVESLSSIEKGNKMFYNYLGRIIHHIQDMSTPSHVLPIYHGPELPFRLKLSIIDDHFENFMEQNDYRISLNGVSNETVIDGLNKHSDFMTIYQSSAQETLRDTLKINDRVAIEERPYSKFWKHCSEEENGKVKGFGIYGECHEYFKELPENNSHNITTQDLYQIQEIVTTHAIVNTCKALLLADRIFGND